MSSLVDGFEALSLSAPEEATREGYLSYLATLDYVKNHSLLMFSALTHPERSGVYSQKDDYIKAKAFFLQLAEQTTEAFYKTLLGHKVEFEPLGTMETQCKIIDYGKTVASSIRDLNAVKIQEVDHPLVIGLFAHQNAIQFPKTDAIVALPLGGLQPALATKLAFQLTQGTKPQVLVVPLSTHNGSEHHAKHLTTEQISERFLNDDVAGKRVLIAEDNSNTGRTLQIICSACQQAGALAVVPSLVEADPRRVIEKAKQAERRVALGEESAVADLRITNFAECLPAAVRSARIRLVTTGDSKSSTIKYGRPFDKTLALIATRKSQDLFRKLLRLVPEDNFRGHEDEVEVDNGTNAVSAGSPLDESNLR